MDTGQIAFPNGPTGMRYGIEVHKPATQMYFNRVDICEAWFLFLSNYHWGQGSDMYMRLSRMLRYFKPGAMLRYESLSFNGKAIYDNLVDTKGESCRIG